MFLIAFLFASLIVNSVRPARISKCCGLNQTLSVYDTDLQCEEIASDWTRKLMIHPKRNYTGVPDDWMVVENNFPSCKTPFFPVPIYFTQGDVFVVTKDAKTHIYLNDIKQYLSKNVCIDDGMLLVCSDFYNIHYRKTFINRCCVDGMQYSVHQQNCVRVNNTKSIQVSSDFKVKFKFPCTDKFGIFGNFSSYNLKLDGSLKIDDDQKSIPSDLYCLEYVDDDDEPSVFACRQYIAQPSQTSNPDSDLRFTMYPIALTLGIIFLAATLIASFLLPASHHVLHWRCQTNYVLCLLLGNILLCVAQFSGGSIIGTPCSILAISMHFLYLAAFFWLNTMCFNIWWTFRDLRPQNLEKSQERCRLRLYEIYAWGFPAVIATTGLILDLAGDGTTFYQPGFAKSKCWFQGNMEIMVYFFIPVGILLAINLTLFAITARELTCGLWKRELVKSTTERAALGRVCLKLVVVMGISWTADIISWMVGGPQEVWYFTDIMNCLSGVFIFIVVGCQPQVLTAVKRYWCWRRGSAVETAGTTNHQSSSSQGHPSMGDTVSSHSITNNTTRSIALETSC